MEKFELVPDKSIFSELSPEEITLFFVLLGLNASQSLTIDELNTLANGLFSLAQVMFTIAAQRTLLNDFIDAQNAKETAEQAKKEDKKSENLDSVIKNLQNQIDEMQKQIDILTCN